jgi:hypothetical protein
LGVALLTVQPITIPYAPRRLFRAYHDRQQRWACMCVHRRAGKTVANINDLIRRGVELQREDGRLAYIAPYLNQAKDVAWTYLKRYAAPLNPRINESELWIEIPNAGGHTSRVRIYGADNAERLRGGYLDAAVVDEFADIAPSIYGEIIRPMLADRGGWATFIGTIKGRNHLHALHEARKHDPDWYCLYARASETGLLPAEELADSRATMTAEQYAQEFELDPDAAIIGAYYGTELAEAERAGRICDVPYDDALPVHTAWDLGMGDSTAIWWFQIVGSELRVIDYYENSGQALGHYTAVCAAKGYCQGDDWVPHDAKVRELGTGRTRVETLTSLGRKPRLVPDHKLMDGINALRLSLPRMWFDASRCRDGVEALKQYRAEYDDKKRVFSDRPRHDWTSHTADAARYMAMAWREIVPETVPEPGRRLAVGRGNTATFNDLWGTAPRQHRDRW